jgi:DNA polymerase III subunit delta'
MGSNMVMYDDRIASRLSRLAAAPHHAYLFSGARGVGKGAAARWFAACLQCEGTKRPCGECQSCLLSASGSHPEVLLLSDDGARVKIEQIRSLGRDLGLSRVLGRYRIAIIEEARRLTREAEAALLKTLEEPARGVVIILTDSTGELASTILSRCHLVRFPRLSEERMREAFPGLSAEVLQIASGRPGLAATLQDNDELERWRDERGAAQALLGADLDVRFQEAEGLAKRDDLTRLLGEWSLSLHEELRVSEATPARSQELRMLIEAIEEAREDIGRGANPRLALEAFFVSLEE